MPDTQTVFVARGRSVVADGVTHKPGDSLALPTDEAKRLIALGFVGTAPPVLLPPAVPNPTGIGLQFGGTVQGPEFRR